MSPAVPYYIVEHHGDAPHGYGVIERATAVTIAAGLSETDAHRLCKEMNAAVDAALFYHAHELYAGLAYIVHLEAVISVLRRFGFATPTLIMATWLHDTLEAGAKSIDLLIRGIPERPIEIAERVTDRPGRNRRERKAATYPIIASDLDAVKLKLSDRIANVEMGGPLVDMYRKEHPAFRRALYHPELGLDAMWAHLDRLLL